MDHERSFHGSSSIAIQLTTSEDNMNISSPLEQDQTKIIASKTTDLNHIVDEDDSPMMFLLINIHMVSYFLSLSLTEIHYERNSMITHVHSSHASFRNNI